MIANNFIKPDLFKQSDPAHTNPLVAQLTHAPFPELARTLRAGADQITIAWDSSVRRAMPQMRHLTYDELKDSTPQILLAIADALASGDPTVIQELVGWAPRQGLSRFLMNFDVVEVMQEDRLLRAIIVLHVESVLKRRLEADEAAALHANIDLMLQRSVIALVDEQKVELRKAAATELKFLSFMSHDMNNNLNNVNLMLEVLKLDLQQSTDNAAAIESLDQARQSIADTAAGMRRMLENEHLRQSGEPTNFSPVDLKSLASSAVGQFSNAAAAKGIKLEVEFPAVAEIHSDSALVTLVLQNLIGNAVKYSHQGTIRVGFVSPKNVAGKIDRGPSLWVSDEGVGIAADKVADIFRAFRRGAVHGQWGVGLGLAIASQGAKLLGADLTVKSQIGVGSTFLLTFPSTITGSRD
jgi:signal transduction histidine kinase